MNSLVFSPVLPWPVLLVLGLVLITGCVLLAVRTSGRRLQWGLRAGAAALLLVALLRPGLPVPGLTERAESALDVFVAIDTTASIVAEDWDGDAPRLDGVVDDVAALMEQAPGARFTLVTFASTTQTVVPLTTDDAAVRSALDTLRPELTRYSSGTSITEPTAHLQDRLEAAAEDRPENARVLFYLGDGEQTSGEEPQPMAGLAELVDGGAVFAYGTQAGGPMLETTNHWNTAPAVYIEDPDTGRPAVSQADPDALRELAAEMGLEFAERSAQSPVSFDFPDVERTVQEREQSMAGVSEFTWVLFALLALWLAAEAVLAARALRRLGALDRLGRTNGRAHR